MKKLFLLLTILYIFNLTVFSTNYYVSTTGNDSNNGSSGSPWKTISKAISVATTASDVINLGAGTFTESNYIMLPSGVSLVGAGAANTKILVNKFYNLENFLNNCSGSAHKGWDPAINQFAIQIASGNNQTLKGFSMDGQSRQNHGGIYMETGDKVIVDDLNIQNFHFTGLWLHNSTNSEVKNCYLKNNCFGTGGQDAGNIMFHANTGLLIHDNTIVETGVMNGKGGYGIKAYPKWWNSACFWEQWDRNWASIAQDMKIYNNYIDICSYGTWEANGSAVFNISIEFNGITGKNVEINNNYLTNHISLIGQNGTGYDFTSFNVHNNHFNIAGGNGYAMEADAQGIKFHHNFVNGGYYPIAMWGNFTYNRNLQVYYNVFQDIQAGESLLVNNSYKATNCSDMKFYNNTVLDSKGVGSLFKAKDADDSFTNADIRNNLFLSTAIRGNYFKGGAGSFAGTVSHNGFENITPYGTNTFSGNMGVNKTGVQPNPYYTLSAGSQAINAGVNIPGYTSDAIGNPDLGAYEYGVTPWTFGPNTNPPPTVSVNGVTMIPTTASVAVNATSQLTATVAPANATNKTVSWVSSNTAIATVNASGLVTGVAIGTATITVTTADQNKTATCVITVTAAPVNLALNKTTIASSIEDADYEAAKAFDGNSTTRWASAASVSTAWIYVDLGAIYNISNVILTWEAAYASGYQIQTSNDAANWTNIFTTTTGDGATDDLTGLTGNGRYVRMNATTKGSPYDYSIYEFVVYGTTGANVAVTGVTVAPTTAGVIAGATTSLTATVAPANATNKTVSWVSSNTAVATVSTTGVVTGVATGTATITVTTADGAKTATCAVTVPPQGTGVAIPAKIEAEAYTAMFGVQTETTSDAGGGLNVGYVDNGDWLDYSINVPAAGTYTLDLRVATTVANTQMQVKSGTTVLSTVTLPNTGGWQAFQTATTNVSLSAGSQTIRLQCTVQNWNLNWIEFKSNTAPSELVIQAEAYNTMSGITNKGTVIGNFDNGDWLQYNNVNLGTNGYNTFTANVACDAANAGHTFQIRLGSTTGTIIGTITVPNTGGWTTFQTVSTTLTGGTGIQNIFIVGVSNTNGIADIDWYKFSSSSLKSAEVATDVSLHEQMATIKIYPNPSNGIVNLELPNELGSIISVYGITGNLLFKKCVKKEIEQIDLSAYKGLLLIKVETKRNIVTKQIIIE